MKNTNKPQKNHLPDFVAGAAIFLTLGAILAYLFTDTKEA